MDQHKEELATLESVDSGAVYTLALKTHVGFSIDTFRYFAGWCDKIQGSTIPINNARPNSNLCLTKREPLGLVQDARQVLWATLPSQGEVLSTNGHKHSTVHVICMLIELRTTKCILVF